ncbi:hypothetical protein KAS31_03180 [Candidatus Parcubacteria bacterium]|nr:hypothetical protein [Candidatus Parcubacteria bacterium]
MGTFSLFYESIKDDDYICAVDWDWLSKSKWARSKKEGLQWCPTGNLDEESYLAILERFGLEAYANEFPIEVVITMNPAVLTAARREKEKSFGLETIQVISDTAGHHVKADDFGKTERED